MPDRDKGRTLPAPSDVDAHPKGASPFGVMDLTGNVWQWTDEYVDDHTRAAVLRGGTITRRKGRAGISRRPTGFRSTASTCSCRQG